MVCLKINLSDGISAYVQFLTAFAVHSNVAGRNIIQHRYLGYGVRLFASLQLCLCRHCLDLLGRCLQMKDFNLIRVHAGLLNPLTAE